MLPPWERRRHACELPAIRASPTGVTVMRFFPPLKAATIDQIQPGTCFAFDLRGTTHIGIAVVPVFSGEAPAFAGEAGALIIVSPGHPDLDGDPGLLLGSVIQHQPVVIFPEARVVLPTDLQHIHLGLTHSSPPRGALVLVGDDLGVAAAVDGRETWVFSIGTGAGLEPNPWSVWFSSWELVHPGPDNTPHRICRVTTSQTRVPDEIPEGL
jgi:hypothetical protein